MTAMMRSRNIAAAGSHIKALLSGVVNSRLGSAIGEIDASESPRSVQYHTENESL